MQIQRDIMTKLVAWKTSPRRKPLLLKGVRQCGKSWVLHQFGQMHFSNVLTFNFDENPELSSFFEGSLEPRRILSALSSYARAKIVPQETLIVFDEIQLCSQALNSLKYFCEDAPEYAVATAGSLLGITIGHKGGFPVGKVDMLELTPCSFKEYLRAADASLAEYIETVELKPLISAFAVRLTERFQEYLTLGGLPEVLSTFIDTHDIWEGDRVLKNVLAAYESDFLNHVPEYEISKVAQIWKSIPVQFAKENRKFIYGEVRKGARARDLEDALMWLLYASMVQKVEVAKVPEIPLLASVDRKAFKLYPCDVGVLRKLAKIEPIMTLQSRDIFTDFKGRFVENYVLEQLRTMNFDPICYWYNQSGEAEVDFLVQTDFDVVPIEVKSGTCLNAKSLKTFREKFQPKLAIRASLQNLRLDNGLLNIPLYLLSELPRFLEEIRGSNEI